VQNAPDKGLNHAHGPWLRRLPGIRQISEIFKISEIFLGALYS
jgi:hypothetical protein